MGAGRATGAGQREDRDHGAKNGVGAREKLALHVPSGAIGAIIGADGTTTRIASGAAEVADGADQFVWLPFGAENPVEYTLFDWRRIGGVVFELRSEGPWVFTIYARESVPGVRERTWRWTVHSLSEAGLTYAAVLRGERADGQLIAW